MDFYYLIIFSAITGAVGYVIWIVFFVWIAKKAITASQRDLERLLPNLEQLLKTHSNLPENERMQQAAQIQRMLMQANTHMGQMNDIQRQKYDVRMGELMSTASSAGIDWTPP